MLRPVSTALTTVTSPARPAPMPSWLAVLKIRSASFLSSPELRGAIVAVALATLAMVAPFTSTPVADAGPTPDFTLTHEPYDAMLNFPTAAAPNYLYARWSGGSVEILSAPSRFYTGDASSGLFTCYTPIINGEIGDVLCMVRNGALGHISIGLVGNMAGLSWGAPKNSAPFDVFVMPLNGAPVQVLHTGGSIINHDTQGAPTCYGVVSKGNSGEALAAYRPMCAIPYAAMVQTSNQRLTRTLRP